MEIGEYIQGALAGSSLTAAVLALTFQIVSKDSDRHWYNAGLEQGRTEATSNLVAEAELKNSSGLIKLLVDRKGEALAITGNGDGTTTTNYFGNVNDERLMQYIEGEKIPTVFVESLPKIGEQ